MPSDQLLPSNGELHDNKFDTATQSGHVHGRRRSRGGTPMKFWLRVFMLSSTVFALESAYTVEVSYAFPALLKTGMSDRYASLMWAFSPMLGILFQGYLGSASDRSRCRWGKRRPFIVGLAVCVCVCLALFPYGEEVADSVLHLPSNSPGRPMFVFIYTVLAFGFMDFSLDMVEPPVRMYLLDSVSVDQSDRANFIYSVMIAMGVGFGALIGAINWSTLSVDPALAALGEDDSLVKVDNFDFQVRVVFGINLVLFAVCVVLTVFSFSEKNPQRTASADIETAAPPLVGKDNSRTRLNGLIEHESLLPIELKVEQYPPHTLESLLIVDDKLHTKSLTGNSHHPIIVQNGNHANLSLHHLPTDTKMKDSRKSDHNVYRTRLPLLLLPKICGLRFIVSFINDVIDNLRGMVEFIRYASPSTLVVWLVTWFGWMSYLGFSFFFSDYLAIEVYRGSPQSTNPSAVQSYSQGVRMACVLRAFVEIVSIMYTILLDWYSQHINYRWLVVSGNIIHVAAVGIMLLSPSLLTAFLVTLSAAIMGSNQDCVPYMLIHYYHVSSC